ncbi:MAG: DUF2851 family protein [Cyclobacteriaceae bacterium]|nr:DUF2851 family protein [Cyclobacteriaceae bacterium]
MEEAFLHFIWNFQHFNSRDLFSDSGQRITVFHPGFKNSDAGPDFKNAKIKIDDVVWNGHVEIHINAQDWVRHKHQHDEAYNNTILHVVWNNDAAISRQDGTSIPSLELKHIVGERLILKYTKLFEPQAAILCARFMDEIKPITLHSMMDKVLAQRLEDRSNSIFREIAFTENDWEEITWRMLCRNFGFKTNAYPFYELAKSTPLKMLKRESGQLATLEAILFGQAGFLEEEGQDEYHLRLKSEYEFKKRKYGLERALDKHQWKFLRLRPANFPTLRLAQLAALIHRQPNLFSLFIDSESFLDLKNELSIEQSPYWIKHYLFGKPSKTHSKKLGKSAIENLLINTAAPLLFAYGIHQDREELKDRALHWLASIRSEQNAITGKWIDIGLKVNTAFDSQALIGLFNSYCLKKRCLSCAVGVEVLNKP